MEDNIAYVETNLLGMAQNPASMPMIVPVNPAPTRGRKPSQKLEELRQIYKKLHPETTDEELKKLTKQKLEKEMANINTNLEKIAKGEPITLDKKPNPGKGESNPTDPNQQKLASLSDPATEFKSKVLFDFHLVAAGILECLSDTETAKKATGTNLVGLSREFIDDKEQFIEILKSVYVEHKEVIDEYLSPTANYVLFMLNKIISVGMENKKKTLNGPLPTSKLELSRIVGELGLSQQGLSQPPSS